MKKIFVALLFGVFSMSFAQSVYYDNYRRSISGFNWEVIAADLLLSPQQKSQLFALNSRYNDYNSWNSVYGNNPDRWRYDRFSEIERILGANNYLKFKNKYYKGKNPIAVYNSNKNNHKRFQNASHNSFKHNKKFRKGNGKWKNNGKGRGR